MATRLFSHSLLLYSQFPRTVDSRTLEDESPSTRDAAQSLPSNFSVMRFLGERRGITGRAERLFLLVLCPRASPRSHTSNCRSRMLQVHMIRSARLSAFNSRGERPRMVDSIIRELLSSNSRVFEGITDRLILLILDITSDLTN